MSESRKGPRRQVTLTDPRALRAVAHPTRLALIGLLRRVGPLTATSAAERLGESSGSCSFHLRQLAKYGLVEEAGGGTGREKPWRATAQFTSWPDVAETSELAAASDRLRSVIAERYFQGLLTWLGRRPVEPKNWQRAAHFGDTMLYLTASELAGLEAQVKALIEPYVARTYDPALRPARGRFVSFLHLAFPLQEADAG